MKLTQYQHIYFLGIGGIGMSALARYFRANGQTVSGYDKTPTPLCKKLENEGVTICYQDDISQIPLGINTENTLVIFTPAIPDDLKIKQHLQKQAFRLFKRAEILGMISKTKKCLAVAGTHGKTSTSAILGHIMANSSLGCTAFIGGILNNYQSNLILQPESDYMVVEADEFDRSFMHLEVKSTALTSIDADHLDIYGNHQEMQKTFENYLQNVREYCVIQEEIPIEGTHNYGLNNAAQFYASNIRWTGTKMEFTLHLQEEKIDHCELGFPGLHNVENAVAAASLAYLEGVSLKEIKNSLSSFEGVARRFNLSIFGEKIFIDDYAHHPTEIKRTIDSIRYFFPEKKLLAIFQPHLFSRTQDFMEEFAHELSQADETLLLDIYPARERPIAGVSSDHLVEKMSHGTKIDRNKICEEIAKRPEADIILTIGAGDISNHVEEIKSHLKK
ncbi:MAG: UDP-N-acetylmuramate--L-alanine ligase [Flavobacteriales bacterium]|jgi:UDP-N-acetylmuramate--alanine ligase|nr:UDP-N-acetylmuramate--L-alanine ligase [Flavobacteriales bacterium]